MVRRDGHVFFEASVLRVLCDEGVDPACGVSAGDVWPPAGGGQPGRSRGREAVARGDHRDKQRWVVLVLTVSSRSSPPTSGWSMCAPE